MFRVILQTVHTARKSPASISESLVLLAKCDKAAAPVSRLAKGSEVRALSTSSIKFCEKKTNPASSNQDDEPNSDKEVNPKETPILVSQNTEEDSKVIKMAEQIEEPVVLSTDSGSSTQQQTDVKTEVLETPKQVNTDTAKSGKEGLLQLLGAMKVEVTTKRKFKNLNVKNSFEPTPVSKPAAMESTISMYQQATGEASSQSKTLDPELAAAAVAAASTLPNRSQAESELLRQLRQHETITEAQKKGDTNSLGVIIADMKVGKNSRVSQRQKSWRQNQIRFDEDGQGFTQDRGITAELDGVWRKRNFFSSGKRLNIFSLTADKEGVESAVARPTLWDMEFAHHLSQVTNQIPRNRLQEMIQWTKEGTMWQYPINNEAGLEEEASVPFHEHVFLEKNLEEGFPRQGPVRHFMELVVAGLSKNPYLTVQQKKEHISWFRDYFHQKEEILQEADAYLD